MKYYRGKDFTGNFEQEKEDKYTCAKMIMSSQSNPLFYVKWDVFLESLANPFSQEFVRTGASNFRWQKVTEQCFNSYVRFLQKNEKRFYTKAQGELFNRA